MAKVNFSKLKLKNEIETKTILFNEQNIEVKTYLPINNKLELIESVINLSANDSRFYNIGQLEVFFTLKVIENYTNITFTDKQKENPSDLFDKFYLTGLKDEIFSCIPKEELEFIHDVMMKTVKSVYKYQNSVYGVLDTIGQDYSNLSLNADDIKEKLADPESLKLLKGIMDKLG